MQQVPAQTARVLLVDDEDAITSKPARTSSGPASR